MSDPRSLRYCSLSFSLGLLPSSVSLWSSTLNLCNPSLTSLFSPNLSSSVLCPWLHYDNFVLTTPYTSHELLVSWMSLTQDLHPAQDQQDSMWRTEKRAYVCYLLGIITSKSVWVTFSIRVLILNIYYTSELHGLLLKHADALQRGSSSGAEDKNRLV